jgi:diacylglycerol kinase family enzyme
LGDFASAVEALRRRDSVAIDLAEVILRDARGVESRIISASTIALGYVVAVTTIANRMRRLGRYCYAVAAVIATRRLIRASLEIAYDDGARSRRDLTGLIVNNTRHVANFVPFPDADCTDGYLDVMELRAGCFGQNAHNLFAMRGLTYPAAPIRRVRRLAIVLAQPQSVMIDGEIYQDIAELSVRLMPRALECLCRTAA